MTDSDLLNVTGDHSNNPNLLDEDVKNVAIASKQKIAMDILPKTVQDMLNLNIRRFNGKNSRDADQWIKDIMQWRNISKLPLITTFDILLSDEAQVLWSNVKENKTEDSAHAWFVDTFTIKKSFTKKIMELAALKQRDDERFATFEIRTMNLLKEIMSSGMTEEELLLDLLKDKVKDRRLRDSLITKPDIKIDEARGLAKIFETNVESKNITEEIFAVEPRSYANVIRNNPMEYSKQTNQQFQRQVQHSRQEPNRRDESQRYPKYEDSNRGFMRRNQEVYKREETERRPAPTISLKELAKKRYDIERGIQPQPPRKLSPGDCFCCGNRGHMRHECPLKGKCLLCGNDSHNFRQCHLLSKRETHQHSLRVACVQEDEEYKQSNNGNEDNNYYENDERSNDSHNVSLEGRKNSDNLIGSISLVGLRE